MVIVGLLGLILGVAACDGNDETSTLSEEEAIDRVLSHTPDWAGGLTIAELGSDAAGGAFDCSDPENLQEPQEISHHVIEEASWDGGVWTVVMRFYNAPETISETATFTLDEDTGEIGAADDQAGTFLDVTHPSEDDC
jgi:hypothetical protein